MYKNKIMKIAYFITALLVAVAVMINMVAVPVYASEVESLPAYDIGITSSYDNDYVYVNDNGTQYSIPRDTVASGSTSNSYPWSYPNTLEVCALGSDCPVSYWYSPNNKRIVVVSSSRTVGNENVTYTGDIDYSYFVRSYSDGTFRLHENIQGASASGSPIYVTIWDCVDNVRYYGSTVYQSNSAIQNFSYTVEDNNGGVYDDLVCVFSSYEIKGFYEFDSDSDVTTPEYYFDYQYLFFTEDVGYVFVDSSETLDYISNSSDPTKAILYFDNVCNKHVYTSELGTTWYVDNSVSTMYGSTYTMDYSYFYDSAGGRSSYTLVYSNDNNYKEEPLLTPDYGNITDVTNSIYQEEIIVARTSWYEDLGALSLPSRWDTVDWGQVLSYIGGKDIVGLYSYIDSAYDSDLLYEDIIRMQDYSFYTNMTDLYMTYYRFNSDGTYQVIEKTSIYGYIYSIYEVLANVNTRLDLYFIDLHNDIKSVFDNITNTNTYLYDIKGLLQDMPDYSKQLSKLVNLGMSDNELLATNNSWLEQINTNISNLNVGDSSSSSSTSFDDSDILAALEDIDSSVDYIGGLTTFNTVTDVIGNLTDDEEIDNQLEETGSFISSAISSITTGAILTMAFNYSAGLSDGIGWINSNVTNLYDVSGPLQSTILLGVTMSIVGLVVRKGV